MQDAPRRARAPSSPSISKTPIPEVWSAIEHEAERQQNEIELIASENIVSQAVLDAAGTLLTNKYAEGYPGRRYYGGCQYVDVVEQLAIDRAKRLFNCGFANVQPHSGSQANQSVMLALMKPGDTVMGMSASPPAATSPTARRRTCPANGSTPCNMACAPTITASTTTRSSGSPRSTSRR